MSIWPTHSIKILTNEESDKITGDLLEMEAGEKLKIGEKKIKSCLKYILKENHYLRSGKVRSNY